MVTVILSLNSRVIPIAAAALDISCQKQEAIVVADDTDILILLLYFWNSEMGDIILQSMSKNKENMVNIRNVVSHLNKTAVKNLLLLHALGGCDTTSSTLIKAKLLFLT